METLCMKYIHFQRSKNAKIKIAPSVNVRILIRILVTVSIYKGLRGI